MFRVSNLFSLKVIEEKPLGGRLEKEGLRLRFRIFELSIYLQLF